jgi:hypothetical protein
VKFSRITLPLLVVALLAGCGSAGGSGSDGGQQNDAHTDQWFLDDVDTGAAVVTGQFMGVDLLGFTCDISQSVSASSAEGALPSAYAGAVLGFTTVDYQEADLASTAQGELVLPTEVPPTLEISTTQGFWDIGDGGENSAWAPSVTLTLTEVPVPVDGCSAADMLAGDLIDVGSSAQEIVDAFTQVGLKDVSKECPDEWFTWVPPNLSCEEFAARAG